MLFICTFEHLVSFLGLRNLCGQLRIDILVMLHVPIALIELRAFPCKGFLRSAILLILAIVSHVMGVLHVPMFLA